MVQHALNAFLERPCRESDTKGGGLDIEAWSLGARRKAIIHVEGELSTQFNALSCAVATAVCSCFVLFCTRASAAPFPPPPSQIRACFPLFVAAGLTFEYPFGPPLTVSWDRDASVGMDDAESQSSLDALVSGAREQPGYGRLFNMCEAALTTVKATKRQ